MKKIKQPKDISKDVIAKYRLSPKNVYTNFNSWFYYILKMKCLLINIAFIIIQSAYIFFGTPCIKTEAVTECQKLLSNGLKELWFYPSDIANGPLCHSIVLYIKQVWQLKTGLAGLSRSLKGIIEKVFKCFINTINKNIYFIFCLQWKCPLTSDCLILFQILRDLSFLPKWYSQCITIFLIKKDNTRTVLLEEKKERIAAQLVKFLDLVQSSYGSSNWHTLCYSSIFKLYLENILSVRFLYKKEEFNFCKHLQCQLFLWIDIFRLKRAAPVKNCCLHVHVQTKKETHCFSMKTEIPK